MYNELISDLRFCERNDCSEYVLFQRETLEKAADAIERLVEEVGTLTMDRDTYRELWEDETER